MADDVPSSGYLHWTNNPSVPTLPSGTYDVVVYGGTIAGINAAYQAGVNGAKVALLEPTGQLGGMSGPGGLTPWDMLFSFGGNIGGSFWQQYQIAAVLSGANPAAYASGWPTTTAATGTAGSIGYVTTNALRPNSGAMRLMLNRWASASQNVSIFRNAAIATQGGVVDQAAQMNGTTIVLLNTAVGPVAGKVFIDASYEGDLLRSVAAQGHAAYTVGRESSAQYGETLAGRSLGSATAVSGVSFVSAHGVPLSPFILDPGGAAGSGDAHVQPLNFRVPMRTIANGGVAFTKPTQYNRNNYLWMPGMISANSYTALSSVLALTSTFLGGSSANTVTSNDGGSTPSFSMFNNGDTYPDATPGQRTTIYNSVKAWWQGLFYFLANDSALNGTAFQTNAATYGYDPVFFADNGYFPWQMYVREGRRMIGSYVMTQTDILNNALAGDSKPVAMGSYTLDVHACAVYAAADGSTVTYDGNLGDSGATYGSFQFPLSSLIPAAGQCTNLIVPVCISCSHVAWGAIRLEPSFAVLGDAAGLMAYRVAKGGDSNVQSINYTALSTLLTAAAAIY